MEKSLIINLENMFLIYGYFQACNNIMISLHYKNRPQRQLEAVPHIPHEMIHAPKQGILYHLSCAGVN